MTAKSDKIRVQFIENIGHTSTLAFRSAVFPDIPQVTINFENARLGPAMFKNISCYCVTQKASSRAEGDVLFLELEGLLCTQPQVMPGENNPFKLSIKVTPDKYKVSMESTFETFGDDPLFAFEPCVQSHSFSIENHPAFEMARKSFGFFKGKGFAWLSDVERFRAEWQKEPYKEGPWIQRFTTEGYTRQGATALLAPVGWLADDNTHIIATASDSPYELGIRWGPCLHSNIVAAQQGAKSLTAKSVVYIVPADLNLLVEQFKEDFPYAADNVATAEPVIWAADKGILLDGLEGDNFAGWTCSGGSLSGYVPEARWTNGNLHMILYAEGVTEGKGSASWDIPAGDGQSVIAKSLDKYVADHPELTYVAFDIMGRSGDIKVEASVRYGDSVTHTEDVWLHDHSTRRVVLPLSASAGPASFALKATRSAQPCKIVIDNIRGFAGKHLQ